MRPEIQTQLHTFYCCTASSLRSLFIVWSCRRLLDCEKLIFATDSTGAVQVGWAQEAAKQLQS
jgi:hypothetical protein